MKNLKSLIYAVIFLSLSFSCNLKAEQKNTEEKKESNNTIEVYYFHFTRRCATCNAVEQKTKEFLNELYAKKLENKEINFTSINLDEKESEQITEKLEVSGQSLIIVKGGEKVNLTTVGFMNARNNPEKLKGKIKETVDKLL